MSSAKEKLWALAAVRAGMYGEDPVVFGVGTRDEMEGLADRMGYGTLDHYVSWGIVRVRNGVDGGER